MVAAPLEGLQGWLPKQVYGRWVIAVVSSMMNWAAGGAIFGFNALIPALIVSGAFSEECGAKAGASAICNERSLAISNVYLTGSLATFVGSFAFGFFIDAFGPAMGARIGMIGIICGFVLSALALILDLSVLLYPGMGLLGFCGLSQQISVLSGSTLFPGYKGTFVSMMSGSFDLGSLAFVIVAGVAGAGIPLQWSLLGYTGVLLLPLLVYTFLFPPSRPYREEDLGARAKTLRKAPQRQLHRSAGGFNVSRFIDAGVLEGEVPDALISKRLELTGEGGGGKAAAPPLQVPGEVVEEEEEEEEEEKAESERDSEMGSPPMQPVSPGAGAMGGGAVGMTKAQSKRLPAARLSEQIRRKPSSIKRAADSARYEQNTFLEQVQTWDFLFILLYCGFSIGKFNFYLGSIFLQLYSITGDVAEVEQWLSILSIILPLGALWQGAVGQIIDKRGLEIAIFVLVVFSILFSALALVPVGWVQVLTFIALSGFRAFHFSVQSTILAERFGFKNFGLHIGIITMFGGLLALLQFPLLVAITNSGGDFTVTNSIILALSVLSAAFPAWYYWKRSSEKQRVTPNAALNKKQEVVGV